MSMDLYKYEKAMKRINANEDTIQKIISHETEQAPQKKRFTLKRPMLSVPAAAAAVMISGTLIASAFNKVDVDKAFGNVITGDLSQMEAISDLPEITVKGDDRLSFRLIGVGGTSNDTMGTIEITRNDGGTFPDALNGVVTQELLNITETDGTAIGYRGSCSSGIECVDDKTMLYSFRFNSPDMDIVGKNVTVHFDRFYDHDLYCKAWDNLPPLDNNKPENEEQAKLHDELINETLEKNYAEYNAILLDGDWDISFPINYDTYYRTVEMPENTIVRMTGGKFIDPASPDRFIGNDYYTTPVDTKITKIGLSAVSVDVYFESTDPEMFIAYEPGAAVILENGEEIPVGGAGLAAVSSGLDTDYEGNYVMHIELNKITDIDSIKAVKLNNEIISVK